MRRSVAAGFLALGLLACTAPGVEGQVNTATPHSTAPDLSTNPPADLDARAGFADLLADYRQMNDRLERVSAPLRLANAVLCQNTFRDPGFRVHSLGDYPENLQGVAQSLMGLEPNGIYIRSVRRGSPAEAADIQIGDRILRLNGQAVPGGPTMTRFYRAVSRGAFGGLAAELTLRTSEGRDYETSLQAETACDYQTRVFYSEDINGHTDGREIYVTSELMRVVPDDVNLALIVAHEMAHGIAGHITKSPTRALELEADRMALVLMERAGYDIDAAIAYWADATPPHASDQETSKTHPTISERAANFKKEQTRIRAVKRAGKNLTFK